MTSNKALYLTCCLAFVFLVIGVICYAAFPAKAPDKPVRIMFKGAGGNVLFDHKTHLADYDLSCDSCHHHEEDESEIKSCGSCHFTEEVRQVPQICRDCHEPDETHHPEPEKADQTDLRACSDCHLLKQGETIPQACSECHESDEVESQEMLMDMKLRTDAFHKQCIDCHKENEAGPQEKDCSACHVM